MKRWFALAIFVVASSGLSLYAQQQEKHDQHSSVSAMNTDDWAKESAAPKEDKDDTSIFCPTMKTGQLCSHGTASVLQVQGEKHEQWILFAKKFNKAVDTATLELFKDAENVLTPEQLAQLKAWFAVGMNPQINELLFSKGVGPKPSISPAGAAQGR